MIKRCCAVAVAVGFTFVVAACGTGSRVRATRERAYRVNNVGVALLEQLKYPEAVSAFREALAIDAELAIAHLNLSLALLYAQDLAAAEREASAAARLMPSAAQPPYILGLIARAQNRNDVARLLFERVRQIDPGDVGAAINVAQIALEERRYDAAIAALGPVAAEQPYHVTASYVLGLAMSRGGNVAEGQRFLERAQQLRRTGYAVTFGNGYLEQGHYAEAIASTGSEAEVVDSATSPATFTPAALGEVASAPAVAAPFGHRFSAVDLDDAGTRRLAASLGGGLTLLDVDADGALDLFVASPDGQRLLRNGGREQWPDLTARSGLEVVPPGAVPVGAVSADYDNDGFADLFVMRYGGSSLYHNDGNGRFSDVTRAAGLPPYPFLPGAAAFVDVDHDGDVDLIIAGLADVATTRRDAAGSWVFPREFVPAPLQLLRNNRNGTFTDITREARLDHRGHVIAIVPTDYDNHRDIDLLIVHADAAPVLLANQRDGTFRDVAVEAGLSGLAQTAGEVAAATVGDLNKDEWPDLFFAGFRDGVFALSDGHGRFSLLPAPEDARAATVAQLMDYDGDGLPDLVTWNPDGPHLFRNLGREWRDDSAQAFATAALVDRTALASPRALVLADLDRDGHTDLVTNSGRSRLMWRNSGDPRHQTLRVDLRGRVSNRQGVGARIQARAGSLSARVDVSAATPAVAPADLVFGLGVRPGTDVVRVLWPSGILQAEAAALPVAGADPPTLVSPLVVEELDRKPSSCPFLYAWDGKRFEFVTDFLGGGELGYWESPGLFNHPDPVEYVRIRGDQLRPRDGRLTMQVTNELEEVLYLDQVQLLGIAHPADLEVFPNEGMSDPPKPFRLHAVRHPHPPLRAVDDHGHDVTERIARLDRRYPDDFGLEGIRGYAAMHELTIDLGNPTDSTMLLLTGWTDYAFSSDNVAAYQAGLALQPPALEVRDAMGTWRRLDIPVGIPVGRPQTIALDLSGRLRAGEHEVRLTTNMRIYWDQILIGESAPVDRLTTVSMNPATARLSVRGFSAEVRPDGQDPPTYDFERVTPRSPWKAFAGRSTRAGDVRALLTDSDDHFVIARPGDAVAIEFDAAVLDRLPAGWTRTFLLRGDGYSKEMDINSASPDTVEPLPYHGMSAYPYSSIEHYPETVEHDRYRETYNTRSGGRPVPSLVSPK